VAETSSSDHRTDIGSNPDLNRTTARVDWIFRRLPILGLIYRDFSKSKPFTGLRVGICIHIEPKTAALCSVLTAGGAEVFITGNYGTTRDDVADYLRQGGITVYGRQVDDLPAHQTNLRRVADHCPHLIIDNGAELVSFLNDKTAANLLAGTEETTSGANRLRGELAESVRFPVVVVNDSPLKRIVENQHGVGQTFLEGFMHSTNLGVPGKRVVVVGYGWVGRGIARCFSSFGARLCIVDPDPVKALEAAVDGFRVAKLDQVLSWGDVFVTATAQVKAVGVWHMRRMRDGAILANAGHFSTEIDLDGLREAASEVTRITDDISEFTFPDGRRLTVLAAGEMLNLASGGGNPAETMDMGLALQALSLEWLLRRHADLPPTPQPVPREINDTVAEMMLKKMFAGEPGTMGSSQPLRRDGVGPARGNLPKSR